MKKIYFSALALASSLTILVSTISCSTQELENDHFIDQNKAILNSRVHQDVTNNLGYLKLFKQENKGNLASEIEKLFIADSSSYTIDWLTNFDPTQEGTYVLALKDDKQDIVYRLNVVISDLKVAEDGFYLMKDFYQGKLKNNTNASENFNKNLVSIGENSGYDLNYSVMLGDQDSFLMIYDQDEDDNLTIDNFSETIYFSDTSIMSDTYEKIKKINTDKGNIISDFKTYIPFVDGKLNDYVGAQIFDNEVDFASSLNKAYQFYKNQKEVQEALLFYYAYEEKNDMLVPISDDKLNNHSYPYGRPSPSQMAYQTKPIFTYEKIGYNIMQITYHFEDTWMQSAAKMVIKDGDEFKEYGSFAIGNERVWKKYRNPSSGTAANFVGYKE